METIIKSIDINDGPPECDFITVCVFFRDEINSPHKNAEVIIFLDRTITDINEIKNKAIEKAKLFLSQIINS